MIKDSRHSQTVKVVKRENTCIYSKRTRFLVTIYKDRNIQKKVLTNASFGVMFHGGPVRLREEWGGPSEIEVIFIGINPTGIFEIHAEDPC